MTLDTRIEKRVLDNGLGVILLRDPAAPVIAYQTWFRVGSRHETPGRTGIAHLFEHLMFNQTANLAAGEFDRRMEAAGGETNAATWVDWTFYRDSLPASQLDLAIELEADRMQHLTLTEAQVESEREVVLNERRFRVDDDVEGFLGEQLFKLAFTTHPYHWPTIGWESDIRAISPDDARAFYRTFYAPNNATIILVGDFDPAQAMRKIERRYGAIAAQPVPAGALPQEPAQRGERRAVHAKPVASPRALWAWRAPAQGHPDWLPLSIVHELLLGGPSARLHRRLVVDTEVASTVGGSLAPFAEPGLFELYAALTRGRTLDEVEALVDQEIARLRQTPPTRDELIKVVNRLEYDFWEELDTVEGKAEAIGHYETVLGDWRRLFEAARRVPQVTAEDLHRVASTYLTRDNLTTVAAVPSGEDVDDEDADGDDEEDQS